MPTFSALNGFLFIQASPQASQTLSRHMGSFSPFERLLASVGKQVKSSLPCLRTVPSQSLTVAVFAISGGAALKASLINASRSAVAPLGAGVPIVCPAPPAWAIWAAG